MPCFSCSWEIVLWLLEEKKMDPNIKDLESGWTALHRALFYGQIAAARILINVRQGVCSLVSLFLVCMVLWNSFINFSLIVFFFSSGPI